MIKKLLKWLGFTLLGILLALLMLPFVFEDEIKEGLKQALNENLDATVDFQDVGLSFIRHFPHARVSVEKLSVTGKDNFQDTVLFYAEDIHFSLSLPSVFKESIPYELTYVQIQKPVLNLFVNESGDPNYLILKEENPDASYEFNLRRYDIDEGKIHYKDYSTNMVIDMTNIEHSGNGRFDQDVFDLNTKTSSDNFNLSRNDLPLLVNAFVEADAVLAIDNTNKKYTFKENQIKLNNIDFSLDGFLQYIDEDISMVFSILAPDTDFSELYSLVPYAYSADYADINITGQASIDATVDGLYKTDGSQIPGFDVKINVTDGNVKYPTLPKSIKNINAAINVANTSGNAQDTEIDIPVFRFKMDKDNFDGRLSMKGKGNNKFIDLGLKSDINLKDWKNALPLEKITALEGTLKSDFILKTTRNDVEKRNYQNVFFSGNGEVKSLLIKGDSLPSMSAQEVMVNCQPTVMEVSASGITMDGSDANIQLSVFDPLDFLYNKKLRGKIDFDSRKVNASGFTSSASNSSGSMSSVALPSMDLEINGSIDQLVAPEYVGENLHISGKLSDDNMNINKFTGTINGNILEVRGTLSNIQNYLQGNGQLLGDIVVISDDLNINDFITDTTEGAPQDKIFIPADLNINISAMANQLKYDNWQLFEFSVKGGVKEGALVVESLSSNTLGGRISASGMYQTFQDANAKMSFRVDLSEIGFKNTFKSIETFRYLAPISDFISGYFNTTLVMESELDDKFGPVLNSINASGYLETLEGKISGFGPLSALSKKIGITKLSDWAIRNSKNWFEVKDGTVELKDLTYNLGENISMTVGGRHGFNTGLNYHFLFEIPREYLRKNPISGVLDQGLSALEKQAATLGINLNTGEFLLVNVAMTGNISNPTITIDPLGKSDKKLDDMAKDELKKKETEIKENLDKMIDKTKSSIQDTIAQTKKSVQDSLERVIESQKQKVQDSISKIINDKTKGALDSLKNKVPKDSLDSAVIDIAKDKAKKEIEDIKKKLEKFDPLKKKKKSGG